MRILFSILLFITFVVRPTIEISTVMYYQLNMESIIQKYCINKERPRLQCNGKCYLTNQMKVKTQSSSEKEDDLVLSESFLPLFFQDYAIQVQDNFQKTEEPAQNWRLKSLNSKIVLTNIDPPPQSRLS